MKLHDLCEGSVRKLVWHEDQEIRIGIISDTGQYELVSVGGSRQPAHIRDGSGFYARVRSASPQDFLVPEEWGDDLVLWLESYRPRLMSTRAPARFILRGTSPERTQQILHAPIRLSPQGWKSVEQIDQSSLANQSSLDDFEDGFGDNRRAWYYGDIMLGRPVAMSSRWTCFPIE